MKLQEVSSSAHHSIQYSRVWDAPNCPFISLALQPNSIFYLITLLNWTYKRRVSFLEVQYSMQKMFIICNSRLGMFGEEEFLVLHTSMGIPNILTDLFDTKLRVIGPDIHE